MNELDLLPIYQEELEPLAAKPDDQLTQDELDRKNWLTNQIEEIKHRHGIPNNHVPTEGEQIPVRTYEFKDKFDFDAFAGTDDNLLNNIVQSLLNSKSAAVAKQFEEALTAIRQENEGLKAEKLELEYQNSQFQISNKLQTEQIQEITAERNTFKLERDDFENRFNAAAERIKEIPALESEVQRLTRREAELQEQIARMPAPTARQIIDVTVVDEDAEALIRKANEIKKARAEEERRKEEERLANRPRITNVRFEKTFGPGANTTRLAELVGTYPGIGEDGETIRIGTFDFNRYQEVGADDAERFRAEQSTKEAPAVYQPLDATPEVPVIPEVTFPEVGHLAGPDASDPETVARQDAVTRDEFEALKADVEVLKRRQGMVA